VRDIANRPSKRARHIGATTCTCTSVNLAERRSVTLGLRNTRVHARSRAASFAVCLACPSLLFLFFRGTITKGERRRRRRRCSRMRIFEDLLAPFSRSVSAGAATENRRDAVTRQFSLGSFLLTRLHQRAEYSAIALQRSYNGGHRGIFPATQRSAMQMRYFVDKEAGELGTFIKRDIEKLFLPHEFMPRYEPCVREKGKRAKRERPGVRDNQRIRVRRQLCSW